MCHPLSPLRGRIRPRGAGEGGLGARWALWAAPGPRPGSLPGCASPLQRFAGWRRRLLMSCAYGLFFFPPFAKCSEPSAWPHRLRAGWDLPEPALELLCSQAEQQPLPKPLKEQRPGQGSSTGCSLSAGHQLLTCHRPCPAGSVCRRSLGRQQPLPRAEQGRQGQAVPGHRDPRPHEHPGAQPRAGTGRAKPRGGELETSLGSTLAARKAAHMKNTGP